MGGTLSAGFAEFFEFQLIFFLFTAHFIIVFVFAFGANQRDCHSFSCHLLFPWIMGKSQSAFVLYVGALRPHATEN